MISPITCTVCRGDGFLHRDVDKSQLYGRPTTVSVSRVCPWCHGTGQEYLPLSYDVDNKTRATGDDSCSMW
jgi:DnaJ-class molecular chaperone